MRRGLRPNECDKLTKFGWKMVERRRNEVPAQNASTAVPLRSLVMAWESHVGYSFIGVE